MKSTSFSNSTSHAEHVLLVQIIQERRFWTRGHSECALTTLSARTSIKRPGSAESNTYAQWLALQWRQTWLTYAAAERQHESELDTRLRQARAGSASR